MSFPDDNRRLDTACRFIATCRTLARSLTAALRDYDFSETEFRLLWLVRERMADSEDASIEQSALADQSGISPAQVSAIVEKLRIQQVLTPVTDNNDRRRQLWQLTPSGRERLEPIVTTVGLQSRGWVFSDLIDARIASQREDAA